MECRPSVDPLNEVSAQESEEQTLDPIEVDPAGHFRQRVMLRLTRCEVVVPHLVRVHVAARHQARGLDTEAEEADVVALLQLRFRAWRAR